MFSYRVAISVQAAILVAVIARIAFLWNELPMVMASHFGGSGIPDAGMSRDQFCQVMAVLGGATTGLFATARLWLRVVPAQLINIPNRDYWLAPDLRTATVDWLGTWLAWFGVGTTAFLAFAVELVLRANVARSGLANRPMMFALVVYALVVILAIGKLYREFRIPRAGRAA